MKQYYSTFIPGLGEVIKENLIKDLKPVKIDLLLDGLIFYSTSSSAQDIRKLTYLNNSFQVISFFNKPPGDPINNIVDCVINDRMIKHKLIDLPTQTFKSFRVIASKENVLTPIDKSELAKLENTIQQYTHLNLNRSKPDTEFWVLYRNEGYGFFGMRITKHPDYSKILNKGELRPELASILCLLSEPEKEDIFLDPFAGYGAIPYQRSKIALYKHIFACDINEVLINKLNIRLKNIAKVTTLSCDSLKLKKFINSPINKIVTDPPWGYFSKNKIDLKVFYSNMLKSFYNALEKNGVAVLLIGEKELFEILLKDFMSQFNLLKKYNILVSGKKAGIFKLRKKITIWRFKR